MTLMALTPDFYHETPDVLVSIAEELHSFSPNAAVLGKIRLDGTDPWTAKPVSPKRGQLMPPINLGALQIALGLYEPPKDPDS